MRKYHVKKGDEVVVIAGAEAGRRGKVLSINTKKDRVTVEGINLLKKHKKRSADRQQGEIVEIEGSVHLSNVMLAAKFDDRATRRAGTEATA
jgi:large subunit ribosomal protein L24